MKFGFTNTIFVWYLATYVKHTHRAISAHFHIDSLQHSDIDVTNFPKD